MPHVRFPFGKETRTGFRVWQRGIAGERSCCDRVKEVPDFDGHMRLFTYITFQACEDQSDTEAAAPG